MGRRTRRGRHPHPDERAAGAVHRAARRGRHARHLPLGHRSDAVAARTRAGSAGRAARTSSAACRPGRRAGFAMEPADGRVVCTPDRASLLSVPSLRRRCDASSPSSCCSGSRGDGARGDVRVGQPDAAGRGGLGAARSGGGRTTRPCPTAISDAILERSPAKVSAAAEQEQLRVAVATAMQRPDVQVAWARLNRSAATALLAVARGEPGEHVNAKGDVVLDAEPLLQSLAAAEGTAGRRDRAAPGAPDRAREGVASSSRCAVPPTPASSRRRC